MSQDIRTKARYFILRRVNDIGVKKKATLDDSASSNLGLPVSDTCVLSPMKVKSNSHSDKKVHKMFKEQVDFLPMVESSPDKWSAKHAFIAPEKLIIVIVTICFVTEELHPHWLWFLKLDNKNNWVQDVYHIKFVNFFDGFAFKNGRSLCLSLLLN